MSRSIRCSLRRCWRSLRLRKSSYLLRCRVLVEPLGDIADNANGSVARRHPGRLRMFVGTSFPRVAIEADDPTPRPIARVGTFASWRTRAGRAAELPIASLACTSRASSSTSTARSRRAPAGRSMGPPGSIRTTKASWPMAAEVSRAGLSRPRLVSLAGAGRLRVAGRHPGGARRPIFDHASLDAAGACCEPRAGSKRGDAQDVAADAVHSVGRRARILRSWGDSLGPS
jgi:hypothetical protein